MNRVSCRVAESSSKQFEFLALQRNFVSCETCAIAFFFHRSPVLSVNRMTARVFAAFCAIIWPQIYFIFEAKFRVLSSLSAFGVEYWPFQGESLLKASEKAQEAAPITSALELCQQYSPTGESWAVGAFT